MQRLSGPISAPAPLPLTGHDTYPVTGASTLMPTAASSLGPAIQQDPDPVPARHQERPLTFTQDTTARHLSFRWSEEPAAGETRTADLICELIRRI